MRAVAASRFIRAGPGQNGQRSPAPEEGAPHGHPHWQPTARPRVRILAEGAGYTETPVATETHVAGVYADKPDMEHGGIQR
jgi:hypothetical protein